MINIRKTLEKQDASKLITVIDKNGDACTMTPARLLNRLIKDKRVK